ncbi:MAG: glycosyltransferase family 4 protein [Proteobacteria bacterium]|nr:glycosyltransferase family 4 protein [Pseudomonadota bacterium]
MKIKHLRLAILTNMYPSLGDVAWRGVFIEEQVTYLKKLKNIHLHLFHIKGRITTGGSNLNYLKWIFKFPILAFKHRITLVHSHHFLCTFIAKLYPFANLLYTVHEGELEQNGFKSTFIRLAIKMSDYVIFVNQGQYENYKTTKTSYFLPSGISLQKFFPQSRLEVRQQLLLEQEPFYVFFPASPKRKEKNAKFLLDFECAYKYFFNDNKIEIIWGGEIEYHLMPLYMNAVNLLVSFSDYESDGMVFKEAMACNLPVITFDVGNAKVYFGDETAGSIIQKDIKQLYEKMLFWMKKPSYGSKKIADLGMDIENVGEKLLAIYNESDKK